MRNPFVRRHPFGEEELSAYLDGRLSPAESTRLENHLASCEPCRRHLEGLRAVTEGLRALPSAPAPRSFALRPEQVEARRSQAPAGLGAWAFGPTGAAAAALLVFLVLVGVDLGTLGGGGAPESAENRQAVQESYNAEMPALSAAAPPTAAAATAPAPAPALEPRTGADEEKEAGTPEPTAEAATPIEAPAPMAPPATAEEGGDTGRWVLRGFQGAAGAAFLAAMAALVWQRRQRRGADHG